MTNDIPIHGAPGGQPDVAKLIAAFSRCTPWSSSGWHRVRHNDDVRYTRWAGQYVDCKKRGAINAPAFPWDGASDQRCPLADDIVNGIVAECTESFFRAWHAPKAGTTEEGGYAVKLAEYLVNTWCAEDLAVAVERSAQYRETYGWVPLYPHWKVELSYYYRELEMEELVQASQQLSERLNSPGGMQALAQLPVLAGLAQLPEAILDPAREGEAMELLQYAYGQYAQEMVARPGLALPPLRPERLRAAVRDLRREGRAEVPLPRVCADRPCFAALKPWEEFFVTNDCADLNDGVSFRVAWVSEVTLRAMERTEDFNPKWIEEAAKHTGKFSSWLFAATTTNGTPAANLETAMAANGGSTLYEQVDTKQGLIEVVYAVYRMIDEDGVPGVYLTVFHPAVGKDAASSAPSPGGEGRGEGGTSAKGTYAWHGLLRDANGKLPFLVGKREEVAPTITSSRGVPEICNSWQRVLKTHTDATIDWASLGVLPPVNEYASALGTAYKYGPGQRNTVIQGKEPRFMDVPTKGVPVAFEILHQIERTSAKYFGESHPEIPERSGVARRNKMVGSFLMLWTQAIQRALDLCQKNMEDAHFAEITGAPEGWLEEHRQDDALLASKLEFDVRELDPEYVKSVMDAMNTTVIPADVSGIIDRSRWTKAQARMLLKPALATELVQDQGAASKQMFERVKSDVGLMALGQEADYVEMDPAAKAKLDYVQEVLKANPKYQQALQQDQRFAELLQKYVANLQFSLTQSQNKQIGRIGVTPDAMQMEGAGV